LFRAIATLTPHPPVAGTGPSAVGRIFDLALSERSYRYQYTMLGPILTPP